MGIADHIKAEMQDFWEKRLNSGDAPEPERAYVPVEEQYLTSKTSTNQRYKSENFWRELFGRHRCIACGRPYWDQKDAFDCHPEASTYIVWREFACRGLPGARSLADAVSAAISSFGPHGL